MILNPKQQKRSNDNGLYKKALVFSIICLFVVVGVYPTTGHTLSENKTVFFEKQISLHSSDFDQKITLLMKLGHMPSLSACIIKDNSVAWSKGYGCYDLKNNKETSDQIIYMAGSISKTFTATALLQLYEQGLFDLDDDANDYLPFNLRNPNYPDNPITMRMLLAHQSSLSDPISLIFHFFFSKYPYEWLEEYLTPGGSIYDPNIWSDEYAPGEQFQYANTGFELLGFIFERIANQSLEQYCKENIFEPLNMNNTSFHVYDFNIENLAVPYTWRFGTYIPFPHYDIGSTAAGGLQTNVLDLSHFLIAHMNGGVYDGTRILKEDTVNLMHTIQYPNNTDPLIRYCLGWMIQYSEGEIYEGHSGGVFGGTAFMFVRDSDNIGIIFFINKNRVMNLRPHFLERIGFIGLQQTLFEMASEL